jgi:hypothetical protein
VTNSRPSTVVTVAFSASVADTDRRSAVSGNATRRHVRPSVESSTNPDRPTSQQTDGDGEAPAVRVSVAPVASVRHVAPASADRWTAPPRSSRNRVEGFDDTMTVSGGLANAESRAGPEASRRKFEPASADCADAAGAKVGSATAAGAEPAAAPADGAAGWAGAIVNVSASAFALVWDEDDGCIRFSSGTPSAVSWSGEGAGFTLRSAASG